MPDGQPDRPNLLFIFTDEQRPDTMACYGNTFIQTPNLNRFSEQCFVFENAYCTQPVCTPARASILTGLYPHTTGIASNNIPLGKNKTLAEHVDPSYARAYCGKWHLGDEVIAQHGFPTWISFEDAYRKHYSRDKYLDTLSDYHQMLVSHDLEPDGEEQGAAVFERWTAARLDEPLTKAHFVGERTAQLISEMKDQPFVIYANFLEPHMPFTGPLDDLHDPNAMAVGPAFMRQPGENVALLAQQRAAEFARTKEYGGVDLTTEAGWRRKRAMYYGLVTLVDRAVGRVLQALEGSGVANRTIVVFTSDHGEMMGDHGLIGKGVRYEPSVGVPLLMRVPWLDGEGRRIPGRISQIDLAPTLLELLGQPIPSGLDGRSRADVLRGDATLDGNDVVVEWLVGSENDTPLGEPFDAKAPWRLIVTHEGYKLALSPNDYAEFYDLNTDPDELHNRIDDPEYQPTIHDLTERLRRWQRETGDPLPLAAARNEAE